MENNVRDKVRKHYGKIAEKVGKIPKKASCCGPACSCGESAFGASALYKGTDLSALPDEAVNASLGCANPLLFAELKPGETVLDLGSGGGIDVLMSSKYVGDSGKVYGLDMTDKMLRLANKNKQKMGVKNVEFLKGYIEDIPLPDGSVDVIMSNCVINLSQDKPKALKEAYRVLKPGGRFAVADIVAVKPCPEEIRKPIELWYGCIAGALEASEYKRLLETAGFTSVSIDPVHVYTKDVIESEIIGKNRKYAKYKSQIDLADGVFASALIKAVKS
jgi:SAM-dependent methyltransferase